MDKSLVPGEVIENSIWLTGTENEQVRKRYEADVLGAMDERCEQSGVSHGPLIWMELPPDHADVHFAVPDWVQGPNVRVLIAQTQVLEKRHTVVRGFTGELETRDLMKLRGITRNTALVTQNRVLTDMQCDDIIEQVGIEAALETLRKPLN